MEHLGDDRLGPALDRLFDADRAALLTEVVVAVGQRFNLRFDEFHNDSTSIRFCGKLSRRVGSNDTWPDGAGNHLRLLQKCCGEKYVAIPQSPGASPIVLLDRHHINSNSRCFQASLSNLEPCHVPASLWSEVRSRAASHGSAGGRTATIPPTSCRSGSNPWSAVQACEVPIVNCQTDVGGRPSWCRRNATTDDRISSAVAGSGDGAGLPGVWPPVAEVPRLVA
jgi:hypothetical protein